MKGIDPTSHFTFTLTSQLQPTERLLLVQERLFPFIWLQDILLDAQHIVGMIRFGMNEALEDESGHSSAAGLSVWMRPRA